MTPTEEQLTDMEWALHTCMEMTREEKLGLIAAVRESRENELDAILTLEQYHEAMRRVIKNNDRIKDTLWKVKRLAELNHPDPALCLADCGRLAMIALNPEGV